MQSSELQRHLEALRDGSQSVAEVLRFLRDYPYQDLGFAKLDHHRPLRTGYPEVVLGRGKSPGQVADIVASLAEHGHPVLVTKTDSAAYDQVVKKAPRALFNELAGVIVVPSERQMSSNPGVLVLTGGTADYPVATEAVITAELMGSGVDQVHDIGVAGLHRLLNALPTLQQARVIVVVAGMDAALPSVVGGLVSVPVISVPTSTGYGSSFEGLAALLSMLNSCAPGVAVVNIDNGFGAGYIAAQINSMCSTKVQ
jgi:NCAIR mutase (PurE)-related protein